MRRFELAALYITKAGGMVTLRERISHFPFYVIITFPLGAGLLSP
jgi:hypothetical protein